MSEKLQSTDILRKFASELSAVYGIHPTFEDRVIFITQPFDQRKSGKLTLNRQTGRMMFMHNGVDCFCYFVDSRLYQSLREQDRRDSVHAFFMQ